MPDTKAPLFLERKGYRRRRMMDAVRLLPVLGVVLWAAPLLWTSGDAPETAKLSDALRYVFGVWAVLTGLSLWLWFMTRPADDNGQTDQSSDL